MGIARPLLCSVAGDGCCGAEQEANGLGEGFPEVPRPLQSAQHHWEAAAPWPLLAAGSPAGCASQKCLERQEQAAWDDALVPAHLVPNGCKRGRGRRRRERGEELQEEGFAAGHLHLSPPRRGRGSAPARG